MRNAAESVHTEYANGKAKSEEYHSPVIKLVICPRQRMYNERFNNAAAAVKELASQPSDEDLLELYALYKQSIVGDCNTERPGMLDFKGKAKWDAWNGKKGMAQDTAKEQYIAKAEALIASIGKK
ncbi:Acyl-CoA-binding protein [Ooceraea biroi]|uniref:Acyl-CoA-binding protein n=1 Tax=Ooceraea biroi TaxID=2015173 RepID=A0A026WS49_OOCBI|nr:Acyl-CoA-binding protein [Ooceraea biroi]